MIFNPNDLREPGWRGLNHFVCTNAVDQTSGEEMAPHYEYKETGERVRVIIFQGMKGTHYRPLLNMPLLTTGTVEVSAKQWHLMWEHMVCGFADSGAAEDVEFRALHDALNEIASIPPRYHEWQFPIGQQIAILLKQLEHRLRAAHVGRPNPCGESA